MEVSLSLKIEPSGRFGKQSPLTAHSIEVLLIELLLNIQFKK